MCHRLIERNRAGLVEIKQRSVEIFHTLLVTVLMSFLNTGNVAFKDQVFDVRRVEHELHCRDEFAVP